MSTGNFPGLLIRFLPKDLGAEFRNGFHGLNIFIEIVAIVPHIYLGCFVDRRERALVHRREDSQNMTIPKCLQECVSQGYPFAGLEFAKECFCGYNTFAQYGKRPDTECNYKCTGDETTICGGFWRMSIYTVPPGKY